MTCWFANKIRGDIYLVNTILVDCRVCHQFIGVRVNGFGVYQGHVNYDGVTKDLTILLDDIRCPECNAIMRYLLSRCELTLIGIVRAG